jgi:uroporphyrinogen decarboxylase
MNSYERIKAMVNGESVDRPGVSLWRHFFLEDHNLEDCVKAHVAFQEQNDWDVIKVMANAVYFQDQYGATITWGTHENDFPDVRRRIVNSPRDFRNLKPISMKGGAVQREVDVVKRLMDRYGGKVPVLATVFTPTSYAQELMTGNFIPWPFKEVVEHYPDDLKEALKVLTDDTQRLIEEYVKAGVDGFFYANQHMYSRVFNRETFQEFCLPYDLEGFKPALGKTWFNMLHVHGTNDLFTEFIGQYPQEAVNWEDINSGVSLTEMHKMYPDKILMGGIERNMEFREMDREKLVAKLVDRVRAASSSVPSNKLIIATGCSQPSDIPNYRYNALKDAMSIVYGKD